MEVVEEVYFIDLQTSLKIGDAERNKNKGIFIGFERKIFKPDNMISLRNGGSSNISLDFQRTLTRSIFGPLVQFWDNQKHSA